MLFSSLLFLTIFLPVVLLIYFTLNRVYRNSFLFLASIFFYSWGEPSLAIIMLISIMVNYLAGILIVHTKASFALWVTKIVLGTAITLNLGLLVYYKYFNFILKNLHALNFFQFIDNDSILLPVGISFYTFHSISYLMDLYRNDATPLTNPIDLGLYITLFPQLIAGPIVRYHDIDTQIRNREVIPSTFAEGVTRFIQGLGKKVLIANSMALVADQTFGLPAESLPMSVAWIGIICYTLQIYFDFSGYSDMAIGLGKMFGFTFLENFNYPYISKSIQEFWRRWHISLSSWFRDYLYIPLGGSRKGKLSTYKNLFIVFFVTGLWHGASWNFVVWGLYHGLFLIIERMGFSKILDKIPSPLRVAYTLFVVVIGWVFFRSDNLRYSLSYLGSLFGFSHGTDYAPMAYYNNYFVFILVIGLIFSAPIASYVSGRENGFLSKPWVQSCLAFGSRAYYLLILIFCFMELAQNSYNPFIYFRF